MQKTVEQSAGIYREETGLEAAAAKLRELQERRERIVLDDHSHTFNTELTAALELGSMLDVAETILQCALLRTESRGAHQRTDFPARDDVNFLAHSLVFRNADGTSRVEHLPVRITRWPPGERIYGAQPQEAVPRQTPTIPLKRVG
jgi:fumarate reductase flavoprotein subunit